jgi:hypothetical protein
MNIYPLAVIPDALLVAIDADCFEDWMLEWKPTSTASMFDEIRALNARHCERFVRRNVSIQTFLEWRLQNPRAYIAERVNARNTAKAAFGSST